MLAPAIIGFYGSSNSGKTTLIVKTIKYLINSSERTFITNSTGIAEVQLTYQQDFWPLSFGRFLFIVSTNDNTSAQSTYFQANYQKISYQRYSNTTNGFRIFHSVENSNLIEEIVSLFPSENNFTIWKDLKSGLEITIINTSVLLNLSQRNVNPDLIYDFKFLYLGWVFQIPGDLLTTSQIGEIWFQYMSTVFFTDETFRSKGPEKEWLKSGKFPTLNSSSVWFILQGVKFHRFSSPVNGEFIDTRQVLILDSNEQIIWLASSGRHGTA